jgi:hypothetical protein
MIIITDRHLNDPTNLDRVYEILGHVTSDIKLDEQVEAVIDELRAIGENKLADMIENYEVTFDL